MPRETTGMDLAELVIGPENDRDPWYVLISDGNFRRATKETCVTWEFEKVGEDRSLSPLGWGSGPTVSDYTLTYTAHGSGATTFKKEMILASSEPAIGVGSVVFNSGSTTQMTIMKMVSSSQI